MKAKGLNNICLLLDSKVAWQELNNLMLKCNQNKHAIIKCLIHRQHFRKGDYDKWLHFPVIPL